MYPLPLIAIGLQCHFAWAVPDFLPYHLIKRGPPSIPPEPHPPIKATPLSPKEWLNFVDYEKGTIQNISQIKQQINFAGVDEDIRFDVWPYIFGFYDWSLPLRKKKEIYEEKKKEYLKLQREWIQFNETIYQSNKLGTERSTEFINTVGQIEMDVIRTDRSIPFFRSGKVRMAEDIYLSKPYSILRRILITTTWNKKFEYTQGMNEFASILVFYLEDEVMSFWCFNYVLSHLKGSFSEEFVDVFENLKVVGKIVHHLDHQLDTHLENMNPNPDKPYTNFFRWMLLLFRQEYELADVARLWEAIFTHALLSKYSAFITASIILSHRREFLETDDYAGIVGLANRICKESPVDFVLYKSQALYEYFQKERIPLFQKNILRH